MNAQELFKAIVFAQDEVGYGTDQYETVNRWFCGKCGVIHKEKSGAEACCKPALCSCGVEIQEKYYFTCKNCRSEQEKKKEQERFDKAEKLTDWDGPVYSDDWDEYYECLDYFYDDLANGGHDIDEVKYIYLCNTVPTVLLSCCEILENATQEVYEDFEMSDLVGVDDLEKAIEVFNERNKSIVNWEPDYKKVVLLDQEVLDEIKKDRNEELAAP